MTIEATNNQQWYLGTGVETVFGFNFKVDAVSDIALSRVTTGAHNNNTYSVTPQTVDVDYSVTGIGDPLGGEVTLFQPLGAGVLVVIERIVAFDQTVQLVNLGSSFQEVIERGLDRIVGMIQQLEYQVGSSGQARVPRLEWYDSNGNTSEGFDCGFNKLKNLTPGTATDHAATVGQITGVLSGVVVGGPGVITQFAAPGPAASVTYLNQIIVIRDAGNNMSWAQICLLTTTGPDVYVWQIL